VDHKHEPAAGESQTSELSQFRQMQARGLAVSSFCLGFLGATLFWEFPHGATIAAAGLLFGLLSLARGVRGGAYGEPLSLIGVGLSGMAIFAALFTRLIGSYGLFDR
jgi:hypothetical protein